MSEEIESVRRRLDALRTEIDKTEDLIDLAMIGLEEARREESFLANRLEQMVIDELFPVTRIQFANFNSIN